MKNIIQVEALNKNSWIFVSSCTEILIYLWYDFYFCLIFWIVQN